jgi:ribosomal protein S18 acetylase RimI-like enzyme
MGDEQANNEKSPRDLSAISAAFGDAILAVSLDAQELQSELHTPGEVWCVVTGEETPDFNLGMVETGPNDISNLQTLISIMKEYKLPCLLLTPNENPSLQELAIEEELEYVGAAPVMEFNIDDLESAPQPIKQMLIKPVEDINQLKIATKIQAESLGYDEGVINRTLGEKVLHNPQVKVFIGYENGDIPVSTVTVVEHGNIATIWNVGTFSEYQRQGKGTEIMRGVLDWYADRGIESLYLLSSDAGKRLYTKLGFKTVQELDTWIVNGD